VFGSHTIRKLVVGVVSRGVGVSTEHELDHSVLAHKNFRPGALAELSTNHVHLLRSDIVGRDDKNVLVVGNEAFQLSREGLLACTPSV
jgi:hypothetical protein